MRSYRKPGYLLLAISLAAIVLAGCVALPAAESPTAVAPPTSVAPATRPPLEPTMTQRPLPVPTPARPPAEITPAPPAGPAPTGTPAVRPVTPATATPKPSGEGSGVGRQAQLDLARRLNIPAEQVSIVAVSITEMPVGSLGCGPEAGAQSPGLTVGEEVVLRAQGSEFTYRSDGRRLVPCTPADFPGGREPLLLQASRAGQFKVLNLAISDLAGRLGVAKSEIAVGQIEEMEWPDASLGCPQPGMGYAQVVTPGYRIVLLARGQSYEYHTSQSHAVLCPR